MNIFFESRPTINNDASVCQGIPCFVCLQELSRLKCLLCSQGYPGHIGVQLIETYFRSEANGLYVACVHQAERPTWIEGHAIEKYWHTLPAHDACFPSI